MIDTVIRFFRLFSNFPKRQLAVEKWIDDTLEDEKRKKLKELCRTRWVKHHDSFQVFSDLIFLVYCLEAISLSTNEWNRDSQLPKNYCQNFIHCSITSYSRSKLDLSNLS